MAPPAVISLAWKLSVLLMAAAARGVSAKVVSTKIASKSTNPIATNGLRLKKAGFGISVILVVCFRRPQGSLWRIFIILSKQRCHKRNNTFLAKPFTAPDKLQKSNFLL